MGDLAKPDRTILEALIDANGLKPVARALLTIAEERFPRPMLPLRPGDEGYVWPYRPGYVGNADGDICLHPASTGDTGLCKSGIIWVPQDALIEAEAYGWERVPGLMREDGLTQIKR